MAYKDPNDPRLKAAKRRYYARNKTSYYERKVEARKRAREFIEEVKAQRPCMDCGESYPPYVMDFDHRGDKVAAVSRLVADGLGLETIREEIDKCDLVCANCHRIRTHDPVSERLTAQLQPV